MSEAITYERRRPEATTLYAVVQDNLETLYGAVDDGAVKLGLPRFVKKELAGDLDCGLLCRGFARLRCDGCAVTRLVAFACKGRGFCPSCLGRKMSATAANLVDYVMPKVALRQWVLTVPFAWRSRLGFDGELLGAVSSSRSCSTRALPSPPTTHAGEGRPPVALGITPAGRGLVARGPELAAVVDALAKAGCASAVLLDRGAGGPSSIFRAGTETPPRSRYEDTTLYAMGKPLLPRGFRFEPTHPVEPPAPKKK